MISVGVRQLKNSLTYYLRLVDQGHAVLVMNRKRPVAVVCKPDRSSPQNLEGKIMAAVAGGKLLPAEKTGGFNSFKPVQVKGKAISKVILEDRR